MPRPPSGGRGFLRFGNAKFARAGNAPLQTLPRWITLVLMKHSRVERWHPIIGLAERPATIFDISWQGGEQRLIATVRYASDAEVDDGVASAVVIFEDVFAFQVLDENMNWSGVEDVDALLSNVGYPYGGAGHFLSFMLPTGSSN